MTGYPGIERLEFPDIVEVPDDYEPEEGTSAGTPYGSTPLFSTEDTERINAQVLAESSQDRGTVWRSPKFEREQAEREQATQRARQARAERIAAGGGDDVTTELRGVAGERVADVLRLDDIASAASKLAHRVNEEAEALKAQQAQDERERLGAALEAAWIDAESKRKVPDIIGPVAQWYEHERLDRNPAYYRSEALERINTQHAARNHARVLERAVDTDAALREVAAEILEQAGKAADTLIAAGLSVDSTSDEVAEKALEVGDTGILSARKAWRDAGAQWGDLQSARRWVSVAMSTGFDPRHPAEVGAFDPRTPAQRQIVPREAREVREARRAALAQLEGDVWGAQFGDEVTLPPRVDSPAAALVWWTDNGRPAATGLEQAPVAA